jgi:hypothetical protein
MAFISFIRSSHQDLITSSVVVPVAGVLLAAVFVSVPVVAPTFVVLLAAVFVSVPVAAPVAAAPAAAFPVHLAV